MLYLAAVLIVASVALFVAAPLGGGLLATRRAGRDAAETERLEHERGLAMQGLRELEFDREMGKLSEPDYAGLREALMARALAASAALERLRAPDAAPARPRLVKAAAAAPAAPPSVTARIRFCPQCGVEVAAGNFCSECGAPLSVAARTAARAER
ncbi:MAG TPA: zinc ribbon domain-containing protein [Candidatus Binataceae bacterium]